MADRPQWKHRARALASIFEHWGCHGCVLGPPEELFPGEADPEWTCGKPDNESCIDHLCKLADKWTE